MNDIQVTNKQLPERLPDLARFVLVGREKLNAVRAEIRAIDKVGLAQEVRDQKLHEAQDIADAVLDAEVRIGELMAKVPKATATSGNQYTGKWKNDTAVDNPKPKSEIIKEAGFTTKQVERFQTLAAHPKAVEQAKAVAREEGNIVTRQAVFNEIKKPHVSNNSGDNEWFTPSEYIEAARSVMGCIDLDPASNDYANQTVKAHHYYTQERNGLEQEWWGNIWMNPPYSTGLVKAFVDKLISSNFNQAIVLVNNATETEWFRKMIDNASAFVFPSGRIRFEKKDGAKNSPLQGQAFIYFGKSPDRFLEVFKKYGWGGKL